MINSKEYSKLVLLSLFFVVVVLQFLRVDFSVTQKIRQKLLLTLFGVFRTVYYLLNFTFNPQHSALSVFLLFFFRFFHLIWLENLFDSIKDYIVYVILCLFLYPSSQCTQLLKHQQIQQKEIAVTRTRNATLNILKCSLRYSAQKC